jgi:hypothetical protein
MASANVGLLTYNSGVFHTTSTYYSPSVVLSSTGEYFNSMYCFLSRVESWPNENNPPAPLQTQKYIKDLYKNMFIAKRISSNDMAPVIERIDWTSGEIYDYYRDDVDMFQLDVNGTIARRFYVRNKFDQVFKCLWNNNNGLATKEPYFEPGTYSKNDVFQGSDGYKWKYMYTITYTNKLKFLDDTWMPLPLPTRSPNAVDTHAGSGSIDVINLVSGGAGYDPPNADIFVTITGDGKYAEAVASVTSGVITDIVVIDPGSNYTYANVTITSSIGSGANAVSYTSPIGGHGFNIISELGCRHIMLTASFDKSESGNMATNIDFRQIGLISNPYVYFGNETGVANSLLYKLTTDYIVSPGFGTYAQDETVYQSTTGLVGDAYFTSTLLSFDPTANEIKLLNTKGTSNLYQVFYGDSSKTARVALQKNDTLFVPFSGYITYIENRERITRSSDGSEQFKIVLGY